MRSLTAEAMLELVLWRTGVIRARQSDPHHHVTGRRASMGKPGVADDDRRARAGVAVVRGVRGLRWTP